MVFPLWGVSNIVTNILNNFVLISNLELLVINHLCTSCYSILILSKLNKWSQKSLKILKIIPVFLLAFVLILFIIDIPEAPKNLYSYYGYLNVWEYNYSALIMSMIITIICFITLYEQLSDNSFNIGQACLIFGLIVYFSSDIVNFLFSVFLYKGTNQYEKFLDCFFPIRLIVSYSLLYAGLLWKK
jgi:hypothetical protein